MKQEIAEKIRLLRLTRNLSQQNMADELQITVAAFSNIERGVTDISVTRLIQISGILGVDPASFLEPKNSNLEEARGKYEAAISQQLFLIMQQLQMQQAQMEKLQKEIAYLKKNAKSK